MPVNYIISERSICSRQVIDLLAVFIFCTQIGFPVAIRFGHVSRSPVIVLPTNGKDIFTTTEEAAKQSDSLLRCGYSRLPGLRHSIQGLRSLQSWLCCLWNWYAVRNQEASQTSVLFQ